MVTMLRSISRLNGRVKCIEDEHCLLIELVHGTSMHNSFLRFHYEFHCPLEYYLFYLGNCVMFKLLLSNFNLPCCFVSS